MRKADLGGIVIVLVVALLSGCGTKPFKRVLTLSEPATIDAIEEAYIRARNERSEFDTYAYDFATWPRREKEDHWAIIYDQVADNYSKCAEELQSIQAHPDYVTLQKRLIAINRQGAQNSRANSAALKTHDPAEIDRTWRRLVRMTKQTQQRAQYEIQRLIREKPDQADRIRQLWLSTIDNALKDPYEEPKK